MTTPPSFFRRQAGRLLAILLIGISFFFTRLPTLADGERAELTGRFSFQALPLPNLEGVPLASVRQVSPQLEHISAWISSVGAAVALNDLDGDGLPNDACWVDVRVDQAIVAPVPGTGDRYPPLVLDPAGLEFDDVTMSPMGCLPGDMNEDGRMDLLVYYWGRPPIAYINTGRAGGGPGGYAAREVYSGGKSRAEDGVERWFTNAATFADIDGDGHADLIVGNYFPDGARILDPASEGSEAMQHSMSRAFNAGRNRLLLWAPPQAAGDDGPTLHYVEAEGVFDHEVTHGWTLAVGAADLDGDQLPEIYFGNDFGPDRLLHNRSRPGRPAFARLEGERGFASPASTVIGRDSFKGMGTDFGDLNGDGLLDIYVSNIATEFGLQESHFLWLSTGDLAGMAEGRAPYVHGSERLGLSRSGWGWGTRLADFDNDGGLEAVQATGFVKGEVDRWPELQALGTSNDEVLNDPRFWPRFQPGTDLSGHEPNAFFVRAADGRFYNLAENLGLGDPVVTRGIASADVDGDGDLDFAFANQWEPSVFYRNDCPDCRAFLGLHLLLPVAGEGPDQTLVEDGHPRDGPPARPAIGADVTVHLVDGRRLVAQVDGGNGHSGARAPQLHFGLGDTPAGQAVAVDVRWRDSRGKRHSRRFELKPGWHTLYLVGGDAPVSSSSLPVSGSRLSVAGRSTSVQ